MLVLSATDYDLEGAVGTSIDAKGVTYSLERLLGSGGMSAVFEARRRSATGETATVVKLFLPQFVAAHRQTALTALDKEVACLSRLNVRVPPTPFVVRYYESGVLPCRCGTRALELPWLALEYVQGGAFGTTLTERVHHAMALSGHAFDVMRAIKAVESICLGVAAVHEVGVTHRDLKPDNILVCGIGDEELFKITDFGIARGAELSATFGGLPVGTMGYAPPEQMSLHSDEIGPQSDVFALGALAYYLLTGGELFAAPSPFAVLRDIQLPARKSIRDGKGLDPDIARSPRQCDRIDDVIARATAVQVHDRPRSVRDFSSLLVDALSTDASRSRRPTRTPANFLSSGVETLPVQRDWLVRYRPGDQRAVSHVAWNSDGTALAITDSGLAFWTGTEWSSVPLGAYPKGQALRFVRQVGASRWLVGGEGATVAVLTDHGVVGALEAPARDLTIESMSGDPASLAVAVARHPGGPPVLFGVASDRWMKGTPIDGVASVNGLEQVDDATWLVVGRTAAGFGFAALFEPLQWELRPITLPSARAILCCAGWAPGRTGVATGTDGAVVIVHQGQTWTEQIPDAGHLSATTIDPGRVVWACSAGKLYDRRMSSTGRWRCVWSDPAWRSPLVSLHAASGIVRGMAADGAVLEGRYPVFGSQAIPE